MRQSERRKYRDHFQDQSQTYLDQQSFRFENRTARNGHQNRQEIPQASRINAKYYPRKKDDFLSILAPNEETVPKREDYNARNPPRESDAKSQRSERTQPQRTANRSKEGEYVKGKEKLDEELEAYRRKGETIKKRQSNSILECLDKEEKVETNKEEQDLSFTELNQERSQTKRSKNKESFEIKQDIQKEKEENDDTEEWIVTSSRREEKSIEPKKSQQKIEYPPPPKREVKQQRSSNRSLNEGFNEVSKESINQSSNWLDQKILDGLNEDEQHQFSQGDILSNTSQSYVSSIQANSRLHDFDSSHFSQHNTILNQQSFQTILQIIDNSKELETREVELQIISVKNILEIVVKEVSVSKLGMNIELSLKQEGIVVKNSEIDVQRLREYISFEQISVSHPRILNNPIISTFTLCKMKVPSSSQGQGKGSSKFIKKEKKHRNTSEDNNCRQLLRVIKLQLKCMNCQKCSEVPVLQSTNQASLSCRKCDEQMIAKLTKLSLQ